jgi:hypothetical protein
VFVVVWPALEAAELKLSRKKEQTMKIKTRVRGGLVAGGRLCY